jgi:hypothetical protein
MEIRREVAVEHRSLDLAPPREYGSGVTNPGRSRGRCGCHDWIWRARRGGGGGGGGGGEVKSGGGVIPRGGWGENERVGGRPVGN